MIELFLTLHPAVQAVLVLVLAAFVLIALRALLSLIIITIVFMTDWME